MAKRSQLYRSPAEIAKVTTLLEENGGRLAGDSVMADLVRATGHKASELNGLLAEMGGKNLVRRRFGDKNRLVELALVKPVQRISGQAQDEPAAAADPEEAPSAPAPLPAIPDRLKQLVAKVELHGEDGVVVASGMEQAAEMLGYSRQTLAGYVSESKKLGLLETEHRRGRYVIRLANATEVAPPPIAQQSNGASPTTPAAGGLVSLLRAAADRIEAVEHENAVLRGQVDLLGAELNGAGRLQACA